MSFWIFKQSEQELYADETGRTYVYDNRHSVRVSPNDSFIYLDKRGGKYAFNGHGLVLQVSTRPADVPDNRQSRIRRIYTARLGHYVEYSEPLDIRPHSVLGKENRSRLGIGNVNKMGWSISIARIEEYMFRRIVELAYGQNNIRVSCPDPSEYEIPDSWSFVRSRHGLERFKRTVLERQDYTCAICGTILREVMEVAHISGYGSDVKNRANPANGIALCAFCHTAFDKGVFTLNQDGVVTFTNAEKVDAVVELHLSNLSIAERRHLLRGIDKGLLRARNNQ